MHNVHKPSRDELPTARQLVKSTIIAFASAVAILLVAVLPGEYGIDPTGIGQVLGLKRMGDIKVQLAEEAAADAQPIATSQPVLKPQVVEPKPQEVALEPVAIPVVPDPVVKETVRQDEMAFTLTPGQGAEVKVEMLEGTKVSYTWSGNGGRVNYDAHADIYNAPAGFSHSYGKGRMVKGDEGIMTAAFDGYHGWFWRNRTDQNVTVTLRVEGDYINVKRVK